MQEGNIKQRQYTERHRKRIRASFYRHWRERVVVPREEQRNESQCESYKRRYESFCYKRYGIYGVLKSAPSG